MSDSEDRSFWYRLGYRLGGLTFLMVIVFVVSLGGLVLAAEFLPAAAKVTITFLCCFFGGLSALMSSVSRRQPVLFFGGMYILIVALGFSLQVGGSRSTTPVVLAITIGTLVSAIGVVVSLFMMGRKRRELERVLFSDATSAAFFITMLGAITYGLLEVWLGVPKLSMWLVWLVGMGSWGLLSVILQRRYS